MQQRLPLAVLKLTSILLIYEYDTIKVATALTACGIETRQAIINDDLGMFVATALTACGIETQPL